MYFPSETPSPSATAKSAESAASSMPSAVSAQAESATMPPAPPASLASASASNSEMNTALESSGSNSEMRDMDMGNDEPAASLPSPAPTPKAARTARCKKGTRKNKTTGECEPSKKKSRRLSATRAASDIVLAKSRTIKGRITALEHVHHQIVHRLVELESR
jgi:hypothetical protein